MADSLRQVITLWREQGTSTCLRVVASRLSSYPRTWQQIRSLKRSGDLTQAIDFVTRRPQGQGQIVFAMQQAGEIFRFLELVGKRRPRTVLEIGTAAGGTLFLLAQAASADATIFSIDLPGGRFGGGYHWWRVPLYRSFASGGQRIRLLRGSSQDPRVLHRLRKKLPANGIELLFIDGDHSYEGVHRDLETYGALVRPGGLVAFHDIVADSGQPESGVHRLWSQLRSSHKVLEFVDREDQRGYGIGVVEVPQGGFGPFPLTGAGGWPFVRGAGAK